MTEFSSHIKSRFIRCIRHIMSVVAMVALSSFTGMAQVNAEQVMTIGRNVLSMEDYLLAIQYFNMAIKAKPYLADAYYLRGLAKLQLEDYDGAVEDCTLAIARNKYKTEAYKVRGFALQQLGKDSLALNDYNFGLSYNPDDKYFGLYKGLAESSLKNYESADSILSRLIKRFPDMDDAIVARGRLNLMRGDTVAALEDLDRGLAVSHTNSNAWLLKAEVLAKRGEWESASVAMDEVIKLFPDDADFYVNRAYIRYNNYDYEGAMADYDYALTIDPQNEAAVFNRALLRTEVKAFPLAAQDFTQVLSFDPSNFYALYNRGLVYLESGNYRSALADFREIARRYPRFYPAYYAIAECQRHLGNMQDMFDNIKKADKLIANYVDNPRRNPLDRPTIAPGKTNTKGGPESDEDPEVFMEKFNRLMTTDVAEQPQMSFNDKIKGRVQDRETNVAAEDEYSLTFIPPEAELSGRQDKFRNLDDLNRRQYISRKIYLASGDPTPADNDVIARVFAIEEEFSSAISRTDTPRPVDFLGRGISRIMLRNYDGAIEDLTRAIAGSDDFATAIFARSYAYSKRSASDVPLAMADLDTLLQLDPTLSYAWFNKGVIYYNNKDFVSAIEAYSKALQLSPELGRAYYNRGLAYMRQGNKQKAFADLSKAGELGVIQSYNILKRMK